MLGLSFDYHDAAAAIIVDGEIIAAAEEERFSRIKHDPSLPVSAIAWCLDAAGIGERGPDHVTYYEKPLSSYDRILSSHAVIGPRGFPAFARATASWGRSKLWVGYRVEKALRNLGYGAPRLSFAEHHLSHAASAFYPSPFEEAAVLTFDGVGEWATTSIGRGQGNQVDLLVQSKFPDSLGLFYSALTAYCGFAVNDGEYKLMGLAPYGEPRYVDVLRDRVIRVRPDGSFSLDQRWFDYQAGRRMVRPRLAELLDGPPSPLGASPGQREADIARSAQDIIEDCVVRIGRHAHELTGSRNACLAGGVALNAVAAAKLRADGPFDELWTQPAAGDAGGAVGAALWTWHRTLHGSRTASRSSDSMRGAFLGPRYDHDEIRAWLEGADIEFVDHESFDEVCASTAADLADGRIIGWFQGAMEFGPRALGHRSILADARDVQAVGRINRAVKRREGFRPLAPAVLAEDASEWFDIDGDRPFMTEVVPVASRRLVADDRPGTGFERRLLAVRSTIPGVTHVDRTARVQTVDRARNPEFHALLCAFKDLTGCPVVINTSLNCSDEPIVRTPADALRTFQRTGIDVLVLERCTIRRVPETGTLAS